MSSANETNEIEQIKYHAAKFAWERRGKETPSSTRAKATVWKKTITWPDWWNKKFNDNLEKYMSGADR